MQLQDAASCGALAAAKSKNSKAGAATSTALSAIWPPAVTGEARRTKSSPHDTAGSHSTATHTNPFSQRGDGSLLPQTPQEARVPGVGAGAAAHASVSRSPFYLRSQKEAYALWREPSRDHYAVIVFFKCTHPVK